MQYVTHATISNHYLPWYLEIVDIRMEYNISVLPNNVCGDLPKYCDSGEKVTSTFKGMPPHK